MKQTMLQSTSSITRSRSSSLFPAVRLGKRAAFSSSSYANYAEGSSGSGGEGAGQKKEQKKGSSSEERPGTAGRSPFAVFVSVLREELQKSREL